MKLKTRAVLILGLIQTVVMLSIILVSMLYLYNLGMAQIRERANDTLVLISSAVAESFFVSNLPSAKEIVDTAFHDIPGIDYIQVIDENNMVVVEKRKGHDLTPDAQIIVTRTIELGGINFGTFHMHYSTAVVTDAVRQQTAMLLFFSLIGLIVSSILTWFAVERFGNLLENIRIGFENIILDKATIALKVPKAQELSNLVNTYNKLVQKLHPIKYEESYEV